MKRATMLWIFSVGIAVYCLLPYVWFALTSWKSPAELTAIPPKLIPSFQWDFYRSAVEERGLLRYIANSVIVAGAVTCISMIIGSLAAYALARFQLPWTEGLSSPVACHIHVSADRHRGPRLEPSQPLRVGSTPITVW